MNQQTKIQFLQYCLALAIILFTSFNAAHAEYLGLPNGRTANLQSMPKFSVDTGLASGEFASVDYEHQGIRLSYKVLPDTLVYANVGNSSIGTPNATAYGAGLYYEIKGLMRQMHSAFKLSYNTVDLGDSLRSQVTSGGGGGEVIPGSAVSCTVAAVEFGIVFGSFLGLSNCAPVYYPDSSTTSTYPVSGKLDLISADLLLSSKQKFGPKNSIAWYGNIGILSSQGDSSEGTDLTIGGGFVVPWSSGEVFAGLDLTKDLIFGLGLRYNFR